MELYVNSLLLSQTAGEMASHAAAMGQLVTILQVQSTGFGRFGQFPYEKKRLKSTIEDARSCGARLEQLAQATETIANEYRNCELKLTEGSLLDAVQPVVERYARNPLFDVGETVGEIFGGNPGFWASVSASVASLTEQELDYFDRTGKYIDGVRDFAGHVAALSGSEGAEELYDALHDVGDATVFKVADSIDDCQKLVDFLNGDKEKGEDLLRKYGKKIIKKGADLEGPTSGIYANLYWNLAENAAESVVDIIESPTLTTLLGGIVSVTAGTFFEAGADLAESSLDFIYSIFGKDFDKKDFREAMDFLQNCIVNDAKTIANYVGDTVVGTAKAVAKGIDKVTDAVGDGFKFVRNAVAGWLHW